MSEVMAMVQGQQWLKNSDEISTCAVICQALELKPHIIPAIVEYAHALIASAEGTGATEAFQSYEQTAVQALLGQQPQRESANQRRAPQQPQAANGDRYNGVIKSFNESKGYGFVYCEQILELNNSDVFLHHEQKGNLRLGQEVSFSIKTNKKGDPQAIDLKPIGPTVEHVNMGRGEVEVGGPAWAAAMNPMQVGGKGGKGEKQRWRDANKIQGDRRDSTKFPAKFDTMAAIGENVGVIKSFNEKSGFGFIHCTELSSQGMNDVFLHIQQLGSFKVGDAVQFTTFLNPKGQPQAKDLQALDGIKGPLEGVDWPELEGMLPPAMKRPRMEMP